MSFLFLDMVVVLEMVDSPPARRCFAPTQAADIVKAAVSSVPTNTKTATHFWVRVFPSFCKENGETVDLSMCSPKDLNGLLSCFYMGLRTQKDEYYKKLSYMAARQLFPAILSPFLIVKSATFIDVQRSTNRTRSSTVFLE